MSWELHHAFLGRSLLLKCTQMTSQLFRQVNPSVHSTRVIFNFNYTSCYNAGGEYIKIRSQDKCHSGHRVSIVRNVPKIELKTVTIPCIVNVFPVPVCPYANIVPLKPSRTDCTRSLNVSSYRSFCFELRL